MCRTAVGEVTSSADFARPTRPRIRDPEHGLLETRRIALRLDRGTPAVPIYGGYVMLDTESAAEHALVPSPVPATRTAGRTRLRRAVVDLRWMTLVGFGWFARPGGAGAAAGEIAPDQRRDRAATDRVDTTA